MLISRIFIGLFCLIGLNSTAQTRISNSRTDTTIYMLVGTMPHFGTSSTDLTKYIIRNIELPEEVINDTTGNRGCFVRFIIEKDGSLSNIEVLRATHPLLAIEAARIVREMPNWQPGFRNKIPVRVLYGLPIDFSTKVQAKPIPIAVFEK